MNTELQHKRHGDADASAHSTTHARAVVYLPLRQRPDLSGSQTQTTHVCEKHTCPTFEAYRGQARHLLCLWFIYRKRGPKQSSGTSPGKQRKRRSEDHTHRCRPKRSLAAYLALDSLHLEPEGDEMVQVRQQAVAAAAQHSIPNHPPYQIFDLRPTQHVWSRRYHAQYRWLGCRQLHSIL